MIEGYIRIENDGSVRIHKDLVRKFGFTPNSEIPYECSDHSVLFHRPLEALHRVYIEVTNFCNLNCKTCIRNVWEEQTGFMSVALFTSIIDSLEHLEPRPEIFFGGFGEPLTNPNLFGMAAYAKTRGFPVLLITNGTLLNQQNIIRIIDIPFDQIWVSVDSICEDAYESIRKGASFDTVLHNIKMLDDLKRERKTSLPELGIPYVAMKSTINQLPDLIKFARNVHAGKIMVTNVLAHTDELAFQRLYNYSMHEHEYPDIDIILPRIDMKSRQLMESLTNAAKVLQSNILERHSSLVYDCCPFVLKGSVSIRWDGNVSPCLPLLHTSPSYLGNTKRLNHEYFVGSLDQTELLDIWHGKEYAELRKRLKCFQFSPCTMCYHESCEIVKENIEDCFGNMAPACGGCQWGQGFIQCP